MVRKADGSGPSLKEQTMFLYLCFSTGIVQSSNHGQRFEF
jgi:hypothetical protein